MVFRHQPDELVRRLPPQYSECDTDCRYLLKVLQYAEENLCHFVVGADLMDVPQILGALNLGADRTSVDADRQYRQDVAEVAENQMEHHPDVQQVDAELADEVFRKDCFQVGAPQDVALPMQLVQLVNLR